MPSFLPVVNKARKPKFELHLTIHDLNNVPLVNGTSQVKWHLPHSMHSEHRGRTAKCSIDSISHRVTYNYSKIVPLRITIDRNNNLTECPIEFEVAQEFPTVPGGRDEKITLGMVKINLSEYVEESENFPRKSMGSGNGTSLEHTREKNLNSTPQPRRMSYGANHASPTSTATGLAQQAVQEEEPVEDGIVRRYLMQESRINGTLKIGVLMVQIDGFDQKFVAPPLKTAPMFGGIVAGIMAGEAVEPVDDTPMGTGATSSTNPSKTRDASELQDMYRRALAASWSCQPGEFPADECIEDLFSGGDGWKVSRSRRSKYRGRHGPDRGCGDESDSSVGSADEVAGGTLRPSDVKHMRSHMGHTRKRSGGSEKSFLTIKDARNDSNMSLHSAGNGRHDNHRHRRNRSRESTISENGLDTNTSGRSNGSDIITDLAPTMGSYDDRDSEYREGRGREGFRRAREVDEFEVRDDLVSWALPGTMA